MRAIILAGGKGTRLRPLTVYTPKPIVPFLNRPFLLFQLDLLRAAGVKNITLSLNYQPDKIRQLLGTGAEFDVEIDFVTEPSPMGTAGAYKYASETRREPTVVVNGDILTNVELSKVIGFHRKNKAKATIVLTPVEDPGAFGLVETDDSGHILGFLEKPTPELIAEKGINTINAGIYILEPDVLDLIPEGESSSFEYEVFPELLARNLPFYGFILKKHYWRDIGSAKSYLEGHLDYLKGEITGIDIEPPVDADISDSAQVSENSIIADGTVIKADAEVVDSVIGPGVHIGEHATIRESVVWGHARIRSGAEVVGAVLGKGCHLGRNVRVGEGTVLGDKTSLTDYSRVSA